MKNSLFVCKLLVIIFWLVVLINIAIPFPSPFYLLLVVSGVLSLIAHIVEAVIFSVKNKFQDNMASHIALILVFGGFYLWGLKYSDPSNMERI